jgi:hypothetical protein
MLSNPARDGRRPRVREAGVDAILEADSPGELKADAPLPDRRGWAKSSGRASEPESVR